MLIIKSVRNSVHWWVTMLSYLCLDVIFLKFLHYCFGLKIDFTCKISWKEIFAGKLNLQNTVVSWTVGFFILPSSSQLCFDDDQCMKVVLNSYLSVNWSDNIKHCEMVCIILMHLSLLFLMFIYNGFGSSGFDIFFILRQFFR